MDSDNESFIEGGANPLPPIQDDVGDNNIFHNINEWDDEGLAGKWYSNSLDRLAKLWLNVIRPIQDQQMDMDDGFGVPISRRQWFINAIDSDFGLSVLERHETLDGVMNELDGIDLQQDRDDFIEAERFIENTQNPNAPEDIHNVRIKNNLEDWEGENVDAWYIELMERLCRLWDDKMKNEDPEEQLDFFAKIQDEAPVISSSDDILQLNHLLNIMNQAQQEEFRDAMAEIFNIYE